MKSKLLLTLTAALTLGSTSLFAGPGPSGAAPRSTVRTYSQPVAAMKCSTMTIKAGGKDAGTRVVACKDYANIRPTECRLACH